MDIKLLHGQRCLLRSSRYDDAWPLVLSIQHYAKQVYFVISIGTNNIVSFSTILQSINRTDPFGLEIMENTLKIDLNRYHSNICLINYYVQLTSKQNLFQVLLTLDKDGASLNGSECVFYEWTLQWNPNCLLLTAIENFHRHIEFVNENKMVFIQNLKVIGFGLK